MMTGVVAVIVLPTLVAVTMAVKLPNDPYVCVTMSPNASAEAFFF